MSCLVLLLKENDKSLFTPFLIFNISLSCYIYIYIDIHFTATLLEEGIFLKVFKRYCSNGGTQKKADITSAFYTAKPHLLFFIVFSTIYHSARGEEKGNVHLYTTLRGANRQIYSYSRKHFLPKMSMYYSQRT